MLAEEYVDISTIGIDNVSPNPSPLPSSPADATLSYWLSTVTHDGLPAPLETVPTSSDVVIVGSGITGVSCAYHLVSSLSTSSSNLQTKIRSITILEARSFCSGATGRNGGHLTASSALAFTDLAANPNHLIGPYSATLSPAELKAQTANAVAEILKFESSTAGAIRDIINQEDAAEEVGFTGDGNWHICFTQAEVDAFEDSLAQASLHEELRRFVQLVRRVPKTEIDERMRNPVGIQAVYAIPGATLHPIKLVALIYKRAQRIANEVGIKLNVVTNTPVTAISKDVLETPSGKIDAKYIIHATNGYASHLLPHLSSPTSGIVPTRAQVIAVAPTSGQYLWGEALSAGGGYEYGHQHPSSSWEKPVYILGGGREYAPGREWGVADDTTLCPEVSAFLHPYLHRVFPTSYGNKVEMEWSGVMGYTKSKDPLVGKVGEGRTGEWVAAGYSGHGMTRAFGCAKAVAGMVLANAKGEKWINEGLPRCYLTPAARAEAQEMAAEIHEKVSSAQTMVEKEKVVDSQAGCSSSCQIS